MNIDKRNYAVDIGDTDTKKKLKFYTILKTIAVEEKWQLLGNGKAKRFFRFGYVDSAVDPEFKGKSGYYYWTADSMRSDDWYQADLDRAISLLISIDKTIKKYDLMVGTRNFEVGRYNTTVGCRLIDNGDLKALRALMNKYDVEYATFRVEGVIQVIRWADIVKLTELINERL